MTCPSNLPPLFFQSRFSPPFCFVATGKAFRRVGVVLFLLGVFVVSANALTLDEAARAALANNLDLRAARYEVEKARGRLIQAGLFPNPSIELGGRSDKLGNNESEHTISAGFAQAFPIAGRLRFAKAASRVDVAQAMVEIRNQERLLIGQVQREFVAILLLRDQIAANGEFIETNRNFVNLFEQRLTKAEVSEVDVNLAKVELQRLELDNAGLGVDLGSRELDLRKELGVNPATPLKLDGEIENITARFSAKKYAPSMAVNRPDLRLLELSVDRAKAELQLARAEAWEDWTVGLEYTNESTLDEPRGIDVNNFAGIKLSIPLSFWNRNQGKVHEQQATADQAVQQIEALRLSIRTEIATGLVQATRLRSIVTTYQKALLPRLAKTSDLLKKGISEGLTDSTKLIQAQQQQASLLASYLTANTNYVQALIQLETASGGSPYLSKDFINDRTSLPKNTQRTSK